VYGGGVFVNSGTTLFTNCVMGYNTMYPGANSYAYGGGIFLNSGTTTITRCRIFNNIARGGNYYDGYGGGIYVAGGAVAQVFQTAISRNLAWSEVVHPGFKLGGGIYNAGKLHLQNCLIDHNADLLDLTDGIYSSGNLSLMNCTVADNNNAVGIYYNSGTIGMTNSIVWGHSDDLVNFPNDGQPIPRLYNVYYCNIQGGDNNSVQGCLSLNPLFADTSYYHLMSMESNYANGYFTGGSWVTALSNSPCIDACDPALVPTQEPAPNGGIINMGYDGESPVASMTYEITATLPGVTNVGSTIVGHRTATFSGLVTDAGGQNPNCWFAYWITGSASTTMVSAAVQVADVVFSKEITGLTPGSAYEFYVMASNLAGAAISEVKTFNTHPVASGLYVATNGDNTSGMSWSTAYQDPQTAFDIAEPGDIVYLAGQTITNNPAFNQTDIWTLRAKSNVTVIGGYQAESDAVLPGPNDPVQWPTKLRRINANPARILRLNGVTNCTLQNIQILDGYVNDVGNQYAMGIYVNNSTNLTLNACILSNNVVIGHGAYGGGMYVTASSVTLTNCLVTSCQVASTSNGGPGYGGGIYMNSGSMSVVNTVVRSCRTGATNGGQMAGGGIFANTSASLILRRSILVSNRADLNNYANSPAYGGGLSSVGPSVYLQNCLFVNNGGVANMTRYGDGIYYGGSGTLTVTNCTIANNTSNGIWKASGTAFIQDSIVWGNGDDLMGPMSVVYSDIQTTDSFWAIGANGCISVDPLFVDAIYYHLQSAAGYYAGGYFSGGSWIISPTNDSPCIDAGHPASAYDWEPQPNGRRVNMGAYGNTEVASQTLSSAGALLIVR
jgi:hypothetical protein